MRGTVPAHTACSPAVTQQTLGHLSRPRPIAEQKQSAKQTYSGGAYTLVVRTETHKQQSQGRCLGKGHGWAKEGEGGVVTRQMQVRSLPLSRHVARPSGLCAFSHMALASCLQSKLSGEAGTRQKECHAMPCYTWETIYTILC